MAITLPRNYEDLPIVELDGEKWRVLGVGIERPVMCLCHLASVSRVRQQRNGAMPVQRLGWIARSLLEESK